MALAPLPAALVTPLGFARQTFADADLGDPRRTDRLVAVAAAITAHPAASLPGQLADPAATRAARRLFGNDAVAPDAILAPHCAQTRQAASQGDTVLLVQDTTDLDFTAHPATDGLGPIGPGNQQGLLLQSVLAVRAEDRCPLGLLDRTVVRRTPAPADETRTARAQRPRESAIWATQIRAVGSVPEDAVAGTRWVHVTDRGGDVFTCFAAGRETGTDLLLRVVQNRRITTPDGEAGYLVDTLRAQPPAAQRELDLPARAARPKRAGQPARPAQPARTAHLAVSWMACTILPPTHRQGPEIAATAPLPVWAVRAWESDPPQGATPLEWLLVTTVPVVTVADAWERIDWYTARWQIEELHRVLKSGCRIEASRLQHGTRLERLLAVLLPVAVRILQLRSATRTQPHAPVDRIANDATVTLVARLSRQPPADTVARFAAQVARLGGYQDRRSDGPPGVQTLWQGWRRVQALQADLAALGLDLPALGLDLPALGLDLPA